MKARIALIFGALTLIAITAGAHHSTAGIYDMKAEVEVKGKVKEWRFANPHPLLKIEVVDAKGVVQEWDVSYGGSAVAHLKKRGYSAQTFKAGDVVNLECDILGKYVARAIELSGGARIADRK